jgi:hypothetical protein
LPALDEILPRQLQRRLDRLGSARNEIGARHARWRRRDQGVGERLRRLAGEERGVRVGEAFDLRLERRDHLGMAVAEARDRRTARGVEIALARLVEEVDAAAAGRDRGCHLGVAGIDVVHGAAPGSR